MISISDSDPDINVKWWIKSLKLNEEDKKRLLGNEEITDNIVNAAQELLSTQFQHIGGFQDTLYAYNLKFKAVDRNCSSVQIIHTG